MLRIKDAITVSYLVNVPGAWKRSLLPACLARENRGVMISTLQHLIIYRGCYGAF
jgi:hypothetical protein